MLKIQTNVLISTKIFDPEQGDIVIIKSEKLGKDIVKRVIALEGQTVDIDFDKALGKNLHKQSLSPNENKDKNIDIDFKDIELQRAKTQIKASLLMSLESSSTTSS